MDRFRAAKGEIAAAGLLDASCVLQLPTGSGKTHLARKESSSSYVQQAACGKCWEGRMPDDPSPFERAHAALRNPFACREAGRPA